MDNGPEPTVVALCQDHRDELVALFASAFYDYPLFQILLADNRDYSYSTLLVDIVRFWVDIYILNDLEMIGCFREGRLVAAALITPPNAPVDTTIQDQLDARLIREVGHDLYTALQEFEAATESGLPLKTHHFLGILAVDPHFQRQGFGRLLMGEVFRKATESSGSSGVCLTTEERDNVKYYVSLGFSENSTVSVHDVMSWGMAIDLPRD